MLDARMTRENTLILSSVQDRRLEEDRTEVGPRPVRPILWDRRSRFGLVDRPSVDLWPSLLVHSLGDELSVSGSMIDEHDHTFALLRGL